jgi:hypothetical protein
MTRKREPVRAAASGSLMVPPGRCWSRQGGRRSLPGRSIRPDARALGTPRADAYPLRHSNNEVDTRSGGRARTEERRFDPSNQDFDRWGSLKDA